MAIKKTNRVFYTEDYYRMEKLVGDEKFQEMVQWIFNVYEDLGCPKIPVDGFKKYQDYLNWMNAFFKAFEKVDKADREDKLDALFASPLYERIQKFHAGYMTLPPGYFIEFLLDTFGLSSKNIKYKDFLEGYLFFGEKHLQESPFSIRWIRNDKTDKFELMIQLFPYTKREDITAGWSDIVKNQKFFKDYQGKSKKWETFYQDLEIFHVYEKERSRVVRKKDRKAWFINGLTPVDEAVWVRLHTKYPKLTLQRIRKSVSRIKGLNIT